MVAIDGEPVGDLEGAEDGNGVTPTLGAIVGSGDNGDVVGGFVLSLLGESEGFWLGDFEGELLGESEGFDLGDFEGVEVGTTFA